MSNIVILGAGTAGTLVANKLAKHLRGTPWHITVVDSNDEHLYQPGFLFIPFGSSIKHRIKKSKRAYLPPEAEFLIDPVTNIDVDSKTVSLKSGRTLHYDQLVIATGTVPRPDVVPGMGDGSLWHKKIFDFYTLEGSTGLAGALQHFKKGRVLVQLTEMPIKCPVAPLEMTLLAQDYFRRRGLNAQVDIAYVTPLDGAFTKPTASKKLGSLFAQRGIKIITDFQLESIDNDSQELVSYDGRREAFDLLITVPPNRGVEVMKTSGLGDDVGFVPIDKHTLQSDVSPDVWVIGDASNAPTSKAGSVAHFMSDTLVPNILAHIAGKPLPETFDGHANCFIESGRGQALLLDFNYEQEPVTGKFPIPLIGPMTLLAPSFINHLAKLAFEIVYWTMLVRGLPLPFPKDMSIAGKNIPPKPKAAVAAPAPTPAPAAKPAAPSRIAVEDAEPEPSEKHQAKRG